MNVIYMPFILPLPLPLPTHPKLKRIDFYFSKKMIENTETDYPFQKYKTKEIDEKKEKIKLLKIKEPVKKSSWVDYTDTLYEKKELMNILKLKEPIKNSSWIDF